MKFYSFLFILIIFTQCTGNRAVHDYTVIIYKKVNFGYQYSKDLFKYEGNIYRPKLIIDYLNDTVAIVSIFKSEGKIIYTKEELQGDMMFKKMLDLPETRKIEINGNKLVNNGKKYQIAVHKGDSIFCKNQDTLFVYIINLGSLKKCSRSR